MKNVIYQSKVKWATEKVRNCRRGMTLRFPRVPGEPPRLAPAGSHT